MVSNWYRWCINLYYRVVNTLKRTPTKNVTATKYSAQDIQADSLEGVKGAVSEEFRRIQAALNVKPGDNIVTSPTADTGGGTGEATSAAPNGLSGITVYFNNTTMPFLKKVQALTFANKVTNNSYGVNVYPVNFVLSGDDKTDYKQSNDGQIVKVQAKVAIPLSDLKQEALFSKHQMSYTNSIYNVGEAKLNMFNKPGSDYYFALDGGLGQYPPLPFDSVSDNGFAVETFVTYLGDSSYGCHHKIIIPEDGVYELSALFWIKFQNAIYTAPEIIPENQQLYRDYPSLEAIKTYSYVAYIERGDETYGIFLDSTVPKPFVKFRAADSSPGHDELKTYALQLNFERCLEYGFKQGDKISFFVFADNPNTADDPELFISKFTHTFPGDLALTEIIYPFHEVSFLKVKEYVETPVPLPGLYP